MSPERELEIMRRLSAIETVLVDLLSENHHIFVGGVSFATDSIQRLADASGKIARRIASPAPPPPEEAK